MQLTKNQIDDLNIELTIALTAEDYAEQEKKRLSAYRRQADIKGFRKGMAPASLIKKLYGEQALYEAINSIVAEQLDKFITDNQLNILGEPLPSETQPENEWESGKDFEFKFDMGLSPALDFEVGPEDSVTRYEIEVTDKAIAEMKENILRGQGDFEEAEAAGENDYVICDFKQGEKSVEGAYVSIDKVEGDARSKFLGAKVDDNFTIDVTKAFTNETDRASMLRMKKEELAELAPEWDVTIVNVKTFVPATESQETYDKIYGEGVVKSPEEFDSKITERLQANYKQDSDYKLNRDIRAYLLGKTNVQVPEDFLKRWLYENNKDKFTKEQVESEFASFLGDFRWQLVRGYLMKKYGLKVEDKEMLDAAKGFAAYQYSMYGMPNIPEDMLTDAAMNLLKDERRVGNIRESVEDEKVFAAVKEKMTFKDEKTTIEKFRELVQE